MPDFRSRKRSRAARSERLPAWPRHDRFCSRGGSSRAIAGGDIAIVAWPAWRPRRRCSSVSAAASKLALLGGGDAASAGALG